MSAIRKITKQDLHYIKEVIDSNNLFPSALLEDMTADYFANETTQDIWLTKEVENVPVAIAYCAPERMTSGTYNLYLIAVHKQLHGKGIGKEMMGYIENSLRKMDTRILIVETSGLPEFERTRQFYDSCGFCREAVIREFYQQGENKIVFWKKLVDD